MSRSSSASRQARRSATIAAPAAVSFHSQSPSCRLDGLAGRRSPPRGNRPSGRRPRSAAPAAATSRDWARRRSRRAARRRYTAPNSADRQTRSAHRVRTVVRSTIVRIERRDLALQHAPASQRPLPAREPRRAPSRGRRFARIVVGEIDDDRPARRVPAGRAPRAITRFWNAGSLGGPNGRPSSNGTHSARGGRCFRSAAGSG